MGNQKEELQKLYESGVLLTKYEMADELKKIQALKNQNMPKSCLSGWLVFAGLLAVLGVFALYNIYYKYDLNDLPEFKEYQEIIKVVQSKEGPLSDRMTIDGKRLIFFNLGEFKDLDGFTDYAKEKLGGKIQFEICPTKDGSKIAVIKISPTILSRAYFDQTKYKEIFSQEDLVSLDFVGPIIYDLGRKWITSLDPNDKRTSDWQPVAKFERVWLTPKAVFEVKKLLKYIAMGKISESDGNFYVGGRQLTKQEISDMVKFGMLTKKHWYSKPEIVDDYNRAIDIAESSKKKYKTVH